MRGCKSPNSSRNAKNFSAQNFYFFNHSRKLMMESSTCEELTRKDRYLSSIYFPQWRLDSLKRFLESSGENNVTYQYQLDSGSINVEMKDKTENKTMSLLTNKNSKLEWNQQFFENFTRWLESQERG